MAHLENCLVDIPVPASVRRMLTAPPVCLTKTEDIRSLDLIRDFGQDFGCCDDEITQAVNLASGPSDVMIILERPLDSHNYTLTAEEFVQSCPTLRTVDELIKFSTKQTRSIYTVSVVDAFMFKPKKRQTIPDERCHQLLAQMICLKRPKVLLFCQTQKYSDPWMESHFRLPYNNDYKMGYKSIWIDSETEINVLQSFHPSGAVNYKPRNPEYMALLLHHFVAAFSFLHGLYNEPSVVNEISSLCANKSYRGRCNRTLSNWEAADRISNALNPGQTLREVISPGVRMMMMAGEPETERIAREKKCFDDMYRRLLQLSKSPQNTGALLISGVLAYLWKDHFESHPLYHHVMTMLRYRGNEQECWLASENHASYAESIEDRLSNMSLEDTQNAFDRSITKTDSATMKTSIVFSKERQMLQQKLRETADPTLLQKMIKYVEEDCLFEKQLSNYSIYNLSSSLRICRLVSEIKFQIEILRKSDPILKDVEDFIDAGRRLKILIMKFQGKFYER